jgi:hypothetical protein
MRLLPSGEWFDVSILGPEANASGFRQTLYREGHDVYLGRGEDGEFLAVLIRCADRESPSHEMERLLREAGLTAYFSRFPTCSISGLPTMDVELLPCR